jgi:hypothetical protein
MSRLQILIMAALVTTGAFHPPTPDRDRRGKVRLTNCSEPIVKQHVE